VNLAPGSLVGGKYRIVRLIGDGGMGSVHEARHEQLGIPVALKFLRPDIAERPGLAARFLQEARVSATLQSPHVVRVSDVDTAADGSPYLVMELLAGESLQSLLDHRRKLSKDEAVDFVLQVLAGLEVAHALGVVHRDLKPDNVFVTPASGGPLLKLIDFGIAKLRESHEFKRELTRAGVVMGTPEYMPPEQLYAAHEVDARADLYSLGVMAFEMLSGLRPADGDEPEVIVGKVLKGEVRRLGTLEPSLPQGLIEVVERALHPDRDARFATAHDMLVAIAPFSGALSPAGQVARNLAVAAVGLARNGAASAADRAPPAPAEPELLARDTAFAPPPASVVSDTLDDAPTRAVPATLPPDPPGGAPVPPAAPLVRDVPAVTPARGRGKRASSGTRWGLALFTLVSLAVCAVAVAFLLQGQRRLDIPELPPLGSALPVPPVSLEPLAVPPVAAPPAAVHAAPDAKIPDSKSPPPAKVPQTSPKETPTPASPLPFPSIALPSALPPLPSGFPATLPTSLPTALPSGLPQIPGLPFPVPGAPPAPAASAAPPPTK